MRELSLRRHGEKISPTYSYSDGASKGERSTDQHRPDGELSGVVKRYSKQHEASANVTAIGLIKASYGNAIEYTGIASYVRGLIIFWAVVGTTLIGGLMLLILSDLIVDGIADTFDMIQLFFCFLFLSILAYLLLFSIRMEFFRPEDEPVIFDREHKKVYRLFREVRPGLAGLFKRWPLHAAEYDWNLIDAEHNAVLTTTGSTVMRYHALQFIVRKSESDSTIIDSIPIGNTVQFTEFTVAPLWEHIRRFMEENGPHLPPGEKINSNKAPSTLWESWIAVGPLGPSYAQTWKDTPGIMVFYHVLFPLFVPLFFFWGIFNWMSHWTAKPVAWPRVVIDRIKQ
jgi:hypothetical protein